MALVARFPIDLRIPLVSSRLALLDETWRVSETGWRAGMRHFAARVEKPVNCFLRVVQHLLCDQLRSNAERMATSRIV